jgi:hypothetical protein
MTYMLVCTIYILVGLAFTSTIIELVRYVSAMLITPVCTASLHDWCTLAGKICTDSHEFQMVFVIAGKVSLSIFHKLPATLEMGFSECL